MGKRLPRRELLDEIQKERDGLNPYEEERLLRASTGAVTVVGVAALFFVAGFASTYRAGGWNWISVGLGVFSLLGCVGVLETLTTRIVLTDDALHIVTLLSKKKYLRSEIQLVKWEWKAGAYLKLSSRDWVEIPWMLSSKTLVASVRTWLKRAEGT